MPSDPMRTKENGSADRPFSEDARGDAYRGAFLDAPFGIVLLAGERGAEPEICEVNRAFQDITGHGTERLLGPLRPALEVLGLADDEHGAAVERVSGVISGDVGGYRRELRLVHAAGHSLWVQVDATVGRRHGDQPGLALVHVQDITESRRTAQALEARRAVAQIMARGLTVDGAVATLLGPVAEAFEADLGVLWMVDEAAGKLRCDGVWCAAPFPSRRLAQVSRQGELGRDEGLPGRVWAAGASAVVADLAADDPEARAEAARLDGLHGAMAFPVRAGGRLLGVLELASTAAVRPDRAVEAMLDDIAEDLAGMLSRTRAQEHCARTDELLLVEDDMFIARLVREMLQTSYQGPLQLEHATSLGVARARLAVNRPACIVLDLSLPDADGLEGLLALRELAPDVPIVVLTGQEDEEIALRAVQHGAQDYLMKRKIDLEGLARSIKYAIERKEAEQQVLAHRLRHQLTGLPTPVLFLDRVRVALSRSPLGAVALVVLNVDRFRLVNDSLGHEAGDRVLAELARRVTKASGPDATVGSLGADGFAVLIEQPDAELAAATLAQRLCEAVSEPLDLDGEELLLTASIGITVTRRTARRADTLLAEADSAMSRAKKAGGGAYEVFEDALRHRLRDRLKLESGLRSAIDRGELRLHYQPIVRLDGGDVVAFEALVRWEHPTRGLLPPGEFMPVAEESGLVVPLGRWVLEEACQQLASWRASEPRAAALWVNVNLSARQLGQAGVADDFGAAVARAGLLPADICLEVTETSLMQHVDVMTDRLESLKAMGFRIALDDFGTGYSSLSYLQRFPIDTIKLDRSFVAGLHDARESAIVAAVASMATGLGLPAVAEGVEGPDDAERLLALGYPLAQGFWYGRPQPAAEALEAVLHPRPREA